MFWMNYFGNGAPTATEHTCPSCPCGGFMPGAVTTGVAGALLLTVVMVAPLDVTVPGVVVADEMVTGWVIFPAGAVVAAGAAFGAEFNGAPTAISQRWPG